MRIKPRFLIIPALAAGLQAATAGDITGTITLDGKAPEPQDNPFIKENADCSKLHPEPAKISFYTVNDKNGLKDVVVTIKGMSGKSTGASAAPYLLDQKACEYMPYIGAVQTGQKIHVKNSDPLMHNVHFVPTSTGNGSEKNQAQGAGQADLEYTFAAPEDFLRFKCDVHSWMIAYITVVDSPYYSVSDKDGKFKIVGLPPGKYTIEANHRKAGKVTKEIEVKDGNVSVDFTVALPKPK
jgi:plastocyanin